MSLVLKGHLLDLPPQFLAHLGGQCQRGIWKQHHKLIAAETCEQVGRTGAPSAQGRGVPQDFIADLVSEAVVDALEAVEIKDRQGERHLAPTAALKFKLRAFIVGKPVRQIRERVPAGLLLLGKESLPQRV